MASTRLETDSLGTKRIPSSAYYGIQTLRAVENFPISGLRLPWSMIRATVLIKQAAAQTHQQLKLLPPRKAQAIVAACHDVLTGKLRDQFVVDVYQAGAGTSFHMNVNEVLANRAIERLRGRKGDYRMVHPNDDVNKGQSTNDVIPTAMRMACLSELPALSASLQELERAFAAKGRQFRDVVKSGRTHLQDAVPTTLGREFAAYAVAIRKCRERIEAVRPALAELNLGGTAAGTGLNAHPRYRALAVGKLRQWTRLPLKPAESLAERMQSLADFVQLSGALRVLAIELVRIANDLRLLSSGPTTGFNEIELPAVQPGSSIMPGKVNPVMPEMVTMVAYQVLGHDATVTAAAQAGQLELNVMMPVVAYNLLQSIAILTSATRQFTRRCVSGIRANREQCLNYAERSVSIATALNPRIGYAKAAEVVKEAVQSGRPIREIVVERGYLTADQARRVLDPRRLAGPS